MTNKEIAAAIYQLVGPKENILDVQNCMTRLRLQLVNKECTDEQLKKIKEESQTTQKPTLPSTAAPKTTTKSSKNSASKDRSCYVLLTSILIILLTASL